MVFTHGSIVSDIGFVSTPVRCVYYCEILYVVSRIVFRTPLPASPPLYTIEAKRVRSLYLPRGPLSFFSKRFTPYLGVYLFGMLVRNIKRSRSRSSTENHFVDMSFCAASPHYERTVNSEQPTADWRGLLLSRRVSSSNSCIGWRSGMRRFDTFGANADIRRRGRISRNLQAFPPAVEPSVFLHKTAPICFRGPTSLV